MLFCCGQQVIVLFYWWSNVIIKQNQNHISSHSAHVISPIHVYTTLIGIQGHLKRNVFSLSASKTKRSKTKHAKTYHRLSMPWNWEKSIMGHFFPCSPWTSDKLYSKTDYLSLFSRNRSAWPIYIITMHEWQLGHSCVHFIYRSHYTNGMT